MRYFLAFISLCFATVLPANAQTILNQISQTGSPPFGGTSLNNAIYGDFNGDGSLDFATLVPQNIIPGQLQLTTYLGHGDGFISGIKNSFLPIDSSITLPASLPSGPAADFNGDGKLDIAFATISPNNTTPSILVAFGNGDGTFKNLQKITLPSSVTGNIGVLYITDINNDHHPDLVAQDANGDVIVVLGNGNGTFQTPIFTSLASLGVPANSLGNALLAIDDVNQDGFPDLFFEVGPQYFANFYVCLGNGKGGFGAGSQIDLGVLQGGGHTVMNFIGLQDLNGDNKPDLLFVWNSDSSNGELLFLPGNGDGTFGASQIAYSNLPGGSDSLGGPIVATGAIADFNQNGTPEVLVISGPFYTGIDTLLIQIDILHRNSDGSFSDSLGYFYNSIGLLQSGGGSPVPLFFGPHQTGFTDAVGNVFLFTNSGPGVFIAPYFLSVSDSLGATLQFAAMNLSFSATTQSSSLNLSGVSSGSYPFGEELTVGLKPGVQGQFDGTVTISGTDASGSAVGPINVPVFSSGFSILPAAIDFGNVTINTTKSQQLIVTNTSGSPGYITTQIEGSNSPFSTQTSTCNGIITSTCSITVTFAPTQIASASGNIAVTDQNGFVTQISLSGAGTSPGTFSASPKSLSFGYQKVGTTSAARQITLTNNASQPLSIATLAITSPFTQTNSCAGSIASGSTCVISVTVTLTVSEPANGSITITDQNHAKLVIPLTAIGYSQGPGAALSPPALVFTEQLLGTTSSPQSVTLLNTGDFPLQVQSITVSGSSFHESSKCNGSTLQPGATCAIQVTFSPTSVVNQSGTITISDTAPNSPQTIQLSGTVSFVQLQIAPTSLAFGSETVGETSLPQTVVLNNTGQNTGNLPVQIQAITITGPFGASNSCGSPIPAGSSCSISVFFKPSAVGSQTGTLQITDNAPNSPQTIPLSGTGAVVTAPQLLITPLSINFGNQQVNTSATQNITLKNTGNAILNIGAISVQGNFTIANNCGSTLAAGSNCVVNVTFAPTATGSQSGSITITDNAATSPQTVQLNGTGTPVPLQQLQITPTSLTFGSTFITVTSLPQTVMLQNTGNVVIPIQSVTTTGPFGALNACGSSIAPGFSCAIGVFFQPNEIGPENGTLTITDTVSGSPQTVQLSGTGSWVIITASNGSSTSATIQQGATATYNLTVKSEDGFIGTMAVSCDGAPSGMQCVSNPANIAFTSNTPTTNVVFTVGSLTKSALMQRSLVEGLTSLAVIFGIFSMGFRRAHRRLRYHLAILAVCTLLCAITACGGGSKGLSGGSQTQYVLQATFTTAAGEKVQMPLHLTVISNAPQ